jgi:hypothetical protein
MQKMSTAMVEAPEDSSDNLPLPRYHIQIRISLHQDMSLYQVIIPLVDIMPGHTRSTCHYPKGLFTDA